MKKTQLVLLILIGLNISCQKNNQNNFSNKSNWKFKNVSYNSNRGLTGWHESPTIPPSLSTSGSDNTNKHSEVTIWFTKRPQSSRIYTISSSKIWPDSDTSCIVDIGGIDAGLFGYASDNIADKVYVTVNGGKITITFSNIEMRSGTLLGNIDYATLSGTVIEE